MQTNADNTVTYTPGADYTASYDDKTGELTIQFNLSSFPLGAEINGSVNVTPNPDNPFRPLGCTVFDRIEFLTPADTICVLMGMRRIELITQALLEGGRSAATPAVVHREPGPVRRSAPTDRRA